MSTQALAHWKGSLRTASMVAEQIANRWGIEAVQKYDPETNCFTYKTWQAMGFQVKRGEKALKSVTFVEANEKNKETDEKTGNTFKYARNVALFYYLQVEKILNNEVQS